MKKLLIAGASGFLGWHVLQLPKPGWRKVGTWHASPTGLSTKAEAIQLDLTDRDAIWRAMKSVNPDAVFHLAAASSPAFCEDNLKESSLLNVEATTWLAEMCAERHCKFLFTSSEQVYDGLAAPYQELENPIPKNVYGLQKLAAEKAVQAIDASAVIVRLAVMYGSGVESGRNFLKSWKKAWQMGESVTAFYDEIRSFMSGESAATGLNLLLEKGAEGVFNLGGAAALSRYDFAKWAAAKFDLPQAKIIKKSQQELAPVPYRPADLTLDLSKIKELGFEPSSIQKS